MTVTVNKASAIENIFKNFYDLIVAITGFSTIIYPTFPDVVKGAKGDYPIVIINSPEISWETFTLGKSVLDGTITIDIYQTTPKDADLYASDVQEKIETSKGALADVGLRQINLETTSSNMFPQGKIKVFNKTLIFNYKFYFTKSFTY
jgi:hypothetical protein